MQIHTHSLHCKRPIPEWTSEGLPAAMQVSAKKLWQRLLPACCGSVSLLPGGSFQEAVVQLQQSGLTMPVTQTAVDLITQEETIVQVR
jgi:hypothetical protein